VVKRIFLTTLIAIGALAGVSARSEAQPFRGRRVIVTAPLVVGGFYYSPYWLYDPWFGYGFQYPYGPFGYPGYRLAPPEASIRLDVKPSDAEVFVDGYYAGIVDDFDGAFQRLHVAPGEHEIELYLNGFRTVRQRLYLTANNTFKVKYTMEHLGPGEQPEPRPQPVNPPPSDPQAVPQRAPMGRRPQPGPPGAPPAPPPAPPARGGEPSAYGTLAIRVQPVDAEILIDGEAWHSPEARERVMVDLAEGPHTIEIRRPGFRSYVTQVQVRRGETTPVNVSLRSQEER